MAHEAEEEIEEGEIVREWWRPFEAEKPQLADLGTWWQQLGIATFLVVPIGLVYFFLLKKPSEARYKYCTF